MKIKLLFMRLLLMLAAILIIHLSGAQSISYNSIFDISSGATVEHNLSIPGTLRDVTFNDDGSKMYHINFRSVTQYTLTSAYRVDAGASQDGSFDLSTFDTTPQGVAFSDDGMVMFVIGRSTRTIYEFNLTNAFDVTVGVTASGNTFDVTAQQSNPQGMAFNPTGNKMYVYGVNGLPHIDQYNLNTPFDITSTVTVDGVLSLTANVNVARDIAFNADGTKLLVLNNANQVEQYNVTTPYDLTGTVVQESTSFDLTPEDALATGMVFNEVGDRMFIAGQSGDEIIQYRLNPGAFKESPVNNGGVTGQAKIQISGETFANAGATLSTPADYTITGIPTGLTPTLDVAADGSSVSLSFSGNANAHQDAHDVASLVFDFANTAFTSGNAAAVSGATATASGIAIDFNENNPVISYGSGFDLESSARSLTGTLSISGQETTPKGITFNPDGTRVYIIGQENDEINQYSVATPFDITGGITPEGSPLDISAQAGNFPADLTFSSDGTKIFIVERGSREVEQYNLGTAWDINGTVTYSGTSFSVTTEEASPTGIAFNNAGSKMFIVGRSGNKVNQYSLTNLFDITSGVSFDGSPFNVSSQTTTVVDIAFDTKGTKMFILDGSSFGRYTYVYDLTTPFDVTSGVTLDNNSLRFTVAAQSITFNSSGNTLYMISDVDDNIYQYKLIFQEVLIEPVLANGSTDGSVAGSFSICLAEDQFNNAGGTLSLGPDYTIANLPAGLVPSLQVDAGGQLATFSLSGNATNHQDSDDIEGLIFTFKDAAFVGGDASTVLHGTGTSSEIGIDFVTDDPAIAYGSIFDLSSGATLEASENIGGDETQPQDIVFSADGLKLYTAGNGSDEIDQYALVSAFDLRLGMTYEGSFASPDGQPTSLAFNSDGSRFFLLGDQANRIYQFSVSTNFDLTSTVMQEGFYLVSGISSMNALEFSEDGSRMFVGGASGDHLNSYQLTTPFDITGGSPTLVSSTQDVTTLYDFAFSNNGKNLIVLNTGNVVHTYYLETAFDLTSIVENASTFDLTTQAISARGLVMSPMGDRMFTVGQTIRNIDQYQLNVPTLVENNANNGTIDTPLQGFVLTDETFVNAGGTLNSGTHFTVTNLPTGLTPSLEVAASGKSATLLLTGNASNNADADDVNGLIFDFLDGAFTGGSAAAVTNATATNSGIQLDFRDGNASVTYETATVNNFEESFDDNGTLLGEFTISVTDDSFTNPGSTLIAGTDFTVTNMPAGLTPVLTVASDGFSAIFTISGNASSSDVADNVADLIFNFENSAFGNGDASAVANATMGSSGYGISFKELQATLSLGTEFPVTDLTTVGSPFDLTSQTSSPQGITFNADGTKLFVVASVEGQILQYALTTPYKITGGITLQGTPYDVSALEPSPMDLTFNNDGTKMYVVGLSGDRVRQFSLSTPFDINSTVTHEGDFNPGSNPVAVTFSSDGSRLFVVTTSGRQYALDTPFDVTAGVNLVGTTSQLRSLEFTTDGKHAFSSSNNRLSRVTVDNSAFDITGGTTGDGFIGVSGISGLALSHTGSTILISNATTDEIIQYEFPGLSVAEVSENDGSVVGSYDFKLVGDAFTNAGGALALGSDFTVSGTIPAGLVPTIAVLADGSEATLSFTGNATDHQDADDATGQLGITFLNPAFASANASSVRNSTFNLSSTFDFNDNGVITYTPTTFYESLDNNGQVIGSMSIQLTNETFSKNGFFTEGVEYSIAGVPAGLTPQVLVSGSKLSATLTFTGAATDHENSNDLADLVFTFTDEAFTASGAAFVTNAVSASSGSDIDFDDRHVVVRYGGQFDVSSNPDLNLDAALNIDVQEDAAGGFAFSNDGMKMFVVGFTNDEVFQYTLTTAFDISAGVTYSGHSFDVSSMVPSPGDLAFDDSGTKMYVLNSSSDKVEQYQLSIPFDLSGSVTHAGTLGVASQDIQPAAITFSQTGRKLYLLGSSNNKVFQYNLDNSFDVTSGVTYEGESQLLITRNYTGMYLSEDGKRLFLSNGPFPGQANIRQYALSTPFDITASMNDQGALALPNDQSPGDFVVSPDVSRLIVLSGEILQFDLPLDEFGEVARNDGEVDGNMRIRIIQEQFTNAGSNLDHGVDFTINNVPSGLTPALEVAADGASATLSFAGKASSHQAANTINNIRITLNNSAFVGGNASSVENTANAETNRAIEFIDNNPVLFFGDRYVTSGITVDGTPLAVAANAPNSTSLRFSEDGRKMFLLSEDDGVSQFSLADPFETTAGVSFDGSPFDILTEESSPTGLAFSADGMKLFIVGESSESVFQYALNASFDVTAGGSLDGSVSIAGQETRGSGITFSQDGMEMFISGSSSTTEVHQFTLNSAFDITAGMAHFATRSLESGNEFGTGDLTFSPDGYYLTILGQANLVRYINQYRLNTPYDISAGLILVENPYLLGSSGNFSGIDFNEDGSKVFVLDGSDEEVDQYSINTGGFVERAANDGVVEGAATIRLIDEQFANPGGTLNMGTDFTMSNLPVGFTPSISVSADGYAATVTLSGSVSAHGDSDDISGLAFSFSNSAFAISNASEVANSTNFISEVGIDYLPFTANDITFFKIPGQTGLETVDPTNHTVDIELAAGTDLSDLTPNISLSLRATISPNSGVAQDFSSAFTYTVTAEDGTAQDWEVTVTEALADPTDISLSAANVDENSSVGATIGTLSTSDPSFDDSHTYSFISQPGILDADNDKLDIVNGNELVTKQVFDFETQSTLNVVLGTDDGNGGTFSKHFEIQVNDINEMPTDILLSDNTVDESNPVGKVVGTLTSTDTDAGDIHSYTLVTGTGDVDNSSFDIVDDELVTKEVFDFETTNSYSIRIQTEDSGGEIFSEAFTISVNDLPPAITSIEIDNTAIDENELANTLVGTLSTAGEDLSGSFTYTLVTGLGDVDNASFDISGDELVSTEVFNFEVKDSYSIRIKTDNGSLTFEKTFSININDIFESTDANITGFVLAEETGDATIDNSAKTVQIEVVRGTDLSDLTPTITISPNASIDPTNGTTQDFTGAVTYTVTAEDGTTMEDWTVTVTEAPNDETDIVGFTLDEETGSATIDVGAHTVAIEVANGTDLAALTPTITVSDGAIVDPTSGTSQDFTSTVTYTVTAEDGATTQDWEVTVTEAPSSATDIVSFSLSEATGTATIDASAHTVAIEVANGTDLTALTPTITVSAGASIDPAGGTSQDFTSTVTYTVTAEDGTTTQDWEVTVTEAPSSATDILSFSLSEATGSATIDASAHTVAIEVANGTDLTALTPTITVSAGAGIDPAGGTSQDFTSVVTYTVTAEDGTTTQDWEVTVTEAPSSATDILSFSLSEATGSATIDASAHTVVIEVANGTDLTALTPTITVSAGASIDPAGGTSQDFTGVVTYTVTAEDGTTTQDWEVTVTEAPSSATDILSFSLSEATGSATIDASAHTVAIEVANGTDLTSLAPTITVSDGATVDPTSGTSQDFTSTVTYTVTAEDGTTTQDWEVTVTEAPSSATDILSFSLSEATGTATIDASAHTVAIEVANGTDLTALTPTITVSAGAGIDPAGGTSQDFTIVVTYTVTAEDGTTTQDWEVTVTEVPSSATDILSFSLSEATGTATIDASAHTVAIEVTNGTDLTALTPAITVSAGASIDPAGGTSQDFTSAVTYTVTAADGVTTQDWVITVTEEQALSIAQNPLIEIFPNPTTKWLNINNIPMDARIQIFDYTGKLWLEKRDLKGGRLDLEWLSPGVYTLRIHNPSTTTIYNNKIIKR